MTKRLTLIASTVAVVVAVAAAIGGYAALHRMPDAALHDARSLEFRASLDDGSLDASGTPLVTNYVMEIFPAGSSTPLQTVDLGKPAASTDGLIRIELSSLPLKPLKRGTAYEASITAVGPHGRSESDRSNRFAFTAAR
jgi:hypothetical protein